MAGLAVGPSRCCCCCAGLGTSTSESRRRGPAVVAAAWKQMSQRNGNADLALALVLAPAPALAGGTSLGFQRGHGQKRLKRRLRLGDDYEVYHRSRRSLPRGGARMRDDASPEAAGEEKSSSNFTSDDLQYLGKLLGGCTAGAALIKYGSIVLPQTTKADLLLALAVITAPVLVSVLLLLWAGSSSASSSSSRPPSDS